jgi:hypothetical protein
MTTIYSIKRELKRIRAYRRPTFRVVRLQPEEEMPEAEDAPGVTTIFITRTIIEGGARISKIPI